MSYDEYLEYRKTRVNNPNYASNSARNYSSNPQNRSARPQTGNYQNNGYRSNAYNPVQSRQGNYQRPQNATAQRALKNKTKKVNPVRNLVLGTLATAVFVTGISLVNGFKKPDDTSTINETTQSTQITQSTTEYNPPVEEGNNVNGIYVSTFKGEEYEFCTREYFYQLSSDTLENVQDMLAQVKGITPVGTKTGDFYPEYFNADMLSAIAFTESTFRIKKTNGESVESPTGAIGICQLEPIAIKTINKWLKDTMGLEGNYTLEDANDPEKALEICTLLNIRNCKNVAKQGKEIYKQMGVEYSPEMQEKLLYAMYFYGEGNVQESAQNGTILDTYLNPDWVDENGDNYVYKVLENKEMLINQSINESLISSYNFCK